MQYLLMFFFVCGVVAADQITKWLTVTRIPLFGQTPAIPHLFHLTNVRNNGAAFSALQGMRWLFLLIFILFAVAIVWEFSKKRWAFTMLERWCIAAIFAGGLGNVIDRVRLGYVIDMIEVEFISFPVFNVADCFITCGCILLIAHLLIWNRAFFKDGKKA